jgi:hypothetical protein
VKLIWNSGEEPDKKQPGTFVDDVLPAGEYQGEVVKSESRQSPFDNVRTEANPEGWEWSVWVDVQHNGKRYRLFDSIPITHTNRITSALASAGLPVPSAGMKAIEESVLLGKTVTVRTFVSKAGKARIGDYLAPKAVILGKKAGPSRASKTVDHSDIPF